MQKNYFLTTLSFFIFSISLFALKGIDIENETTPKTVILNVIEKKQYHPLLVFLEQHKFVKIVLNPK